MVKTKSTPLEKLFGSKTRAKLLELFFSATEKSFYVREITRVIEEQLNSVRRELANLEMIGVVKHETYDNKVYYSANMKHPYAHALAEIFGRKVSFGGAKSTREVKRMTWQEYVKPIKKYLTALLVTNRALGQEGVDLLIVGDDRTKKLSHWAEVVEKKQGRPLDYVIMTTEDFGYRKNVKDRFVLDILEMDVAEMYDPENLLKGES